MPMMNKWWVIFLWMLSVPSFASSFHVLELDEVRADYLSFFPGGREPLITSNGLPNRELGNMLDLNINTTVMKWGYWRSLVHSYTDANATTHTPGQFRSVGLNMELGIRVAPFIDVFYWHYSQHVLDTTYTPGFPVQDAVGIHIYLYSKDRKDSIIK